MLISLKYWPQHVKRRQVMHVEIGRQCLLASEACHASSLLFIDMHFESDIYYKQSCFSEFFYQKVS